MQAAHSTGDVCRPGVSGGHSWLKKKDMFKYMWLNGGRKGGRQGIDGYVLLPKRMLGRLLHVKVWRGEGGGMSDHFLVEARLKLVPESPSLLCTESTFYQTLFEVMILNSSIFR